MNIVVGYLETDEGRAAVERAVAVARERGGTLHLVGVIESPKNDEEAAAYRDQLEQARERLDRVAAAIGDLEVRAHVPAGVQRPSAAILSVAQTVRADLIVIGMRRRSRVGKLVLGSTAQEILLAAECDVLSVKTAPPD